MRRESAGEARGRKVVEQGLSYRSP